MVKRFFVPVLLIALGFVIGVVTVRSGHFRNAARQITGSVPFEDRREGLFDAFTAAHETVVLGDSISEPIDWSGALGRPIFNRAFGGNSVASAVRRPAVNAKTVLIMLGINDLLRGAGARDVAVNYVALIKKLQQHGSRVMVTSTVTGRAELVEEVSKLNDALRADCACIFVDIRPALGGLMMSEEFSSDGVHLNAAGYRVWLDELKARLGPA